MALYELHANDGEIYEFSSIEAIESFKIKYNLTGTIITQLEQPIEDMRQIFQLHANDGEIYEFGTMEAIEPFKQKYNLAGNIFLTLVKNSENNTEE
jgi:hypothetical protein